MKTSHRFAIFAAAAVSLVASLLPALSYAQTAVAPVAPDIAASAPGTLRAADLTDGEVRKVDKDSKKITIKHGEIRNLDMPGMTMLFQVRDPAFLDAVKPGDKVKFAAERVNGAIVITQIQVVR